MSRRRNYRPETVATISRFFAALDTCIQLGRVRSLNAFCATYGVDKRHLYAQRKDPGLGFFEIGWASPLIDSCNVSPSWLLTGRGDMFSTSR